MKLNPPKRINSGLPSYSFGCVVTHSHTRWCWGLCQPKAGLGQCGRLYPHAFKSRRQRAIAQWQRARAMSRHLEDPKG